MICNGLGRQMKPLQRLGQEDYSFPCRPVVHFLFHANFLAVIMWDHQCCCQWFSSSCSCLFKRFFLCPQYAHAAVSCYVHPYTSPSSQIHQLHHFISQHHHGGIILLLLSADAIQSQKIPPWHLRFSRLNHHVSSVIIKNYLFFTYLSWLKCRPALWDILEATVSVSCIDWLG